MMDTSKIDLIYREVSTIKTKKGGYREKETFAKKMLKNHSALRANILIELFSSKEIIRFSYDLDCDYDIRRETTAYRIPKRDKVCFINYKVRR